LSDEAKALLAIVDVPAYLRRAQRVEAERNKIGRQVHALRRQATFQLRLHLKVWNRLTLDHAVLRNIMSIAAKNAIIDLNRTLFVENESVSAPASVGWAIGARRKWRSLRLSLADFNRRWPAIVSGISLDEINQAIEGYNRFYVFEKECAVRSLHTASMGFTPLPAFTHAELLADFPTLPELPEDFRERGING
jgi:hypothetical protein